jgi:uncharacterized membrane protein
MGTDDKKTSVFKILRKDFITGLIIILPAFLTILIVRFLFHNINAIMLEPLTNTLSFLLPHEVLIVFAKVLAFLVIFLLLIAIGVATRLLVLKKILASLEKVIKKLPLVGTLYFSIKEISHAIVGYQKPFFEKSVIIKFPNQETLALAFVTKTFEYKNEPYYCVYLPTTPNPTSGFMLIVPKRDTLETTLSVEEMLKSIVSAGAVGIDINKIIKGGA